MHSSAWGTGRSATGTDDDHAPERSDVAAGVLAAGAHGDYGLLTLLVTDSQPGLEILHKGVWRRIPPAGP